MILIKEGVEIIVLYYLDSKKYTIQICVELFSSKTCKKEREDLWSKINTLLSNISRQSLSDVKIYNPCTIFPGFVFAFDTTSVRDLAMILSNIVYILPSRQVVYIFFLIVSSLRQNEDLLRIRVLKIWNWLSICPLIWKQKSYLCPNGGNVINKLLK